MILGKTSILETLKKIQAVSENNILSEIVQVRVRQAILKTVLKYWDARIW